jgi:hypothetical protein
MDVRLRQRPDSQTVGMTRLDKEWAIGEIDAFLYATDQIVPDMSGSGIITSERCSGRRRLKPPSMRTLLSRFLTGSFRHGVQTTSQAATKSGCTYESGLHVRAVFSSGRRNFASASGTVHPTWTPADCTPGFGKAELPSGALAISPKP